MTDSGRRFKLDGGLDALATWADTARQAHKNVLYKALFAITDGSVFRQYGVLQDAVNPREFFVMIREDLALKISFANPESYEIVYIGPLEGAPGIDLSVDAA